MSTQLYRHFDEKGRLLYVGISLSAVKRLSQHSDKATWFFDIAKVTIESFPTREAALAAEKLAIRTERPVHNVAHVAKPEFNQPFHNYFPLQKAFKSLGDRFASVERLRYELTHSARAHLYARDCIVVYLEGKLAVDVEALRRMILNTRPHPKVGAEASI